ncbi:hypothetical protein C7379_10759 [Hallella colorans]|uniref:Uncharacterized protein n=1 Tax=Hallella colorans TaxID=1703337 RepID=A0A2U0UBR3_9BACT|nr:hypothetical protein C7379_10759 [Hallella colorans]
MANNCVFSTFYKYSNDNFTHRPIAITPMAHVATLYPNKRNSLDMRIKGMDRLKYLCNKTNQSDYF